MKKHIFVSSSVLIATLFFLGCSPSGEIKDGASAFKLERYMDATEMLQGEYGKENDQTKKAEIAFTIGECYRLSNFTIEAETWYNEAEELNYGPDAIYYNALMKKSNEKYQRAIEKFNEYIKASPENKKKADLQIEGCKLAIEWKAMKTKYQISKITTLNTPYSDFAPTFYENKSIVFTSSREDATGSKLYGKTGEKFFDIFVSNVGQGDRYDEPIPFEDNIVNTEHNEGTVSFNSDYTVMYFTRCSNKNKKETDNCLIYTREKDENGKWGNEKVVELFDDSIDVGHPLLIDEGKRLIFVSNNLKGFGGKDIYVAQKTENGWSMPVNLGPKINTSGNEMFPFLHKDGSLFFSSDGHVGMGGLDLFYAEKEGDLWGSPHNMQAPINSGADDFGLIFDEYDLLDQSGYYEANGYFTSSRPGGMGSDDIYKFILRKPAYFELEVTVQEAVNKDPDDPSSEIVFNPLEGAEIKLSKINDEGFPVALRFDTADVNGQSLFQIESETDYQIKASKSGYLAKQELFSTREIKGSQRIRIKLTLEIILVPIDTGVPITIPNIYYDFDKWNIRADAAKVLDEVAEILLVNTEITAELGSHTDSRGSTPYNEKLSQKRAEEVVKYISSKGVKKSRLIPKGYGESKLTNKCIDGVECSEFEHQKNRRTTFTILDANKKVKTESYEPTNIIVDPEMLKRERQKKEEESSLKEKEENTQ